MLICERLAKSFGPYTIFENVNLTLKPGQMACITGPVGVGKSTLLRIVSTIDAPTEGRVLIGGKDPFGLPERELAELRRDFLSISFQEPLLLPELSVLDNVLAPRLPFLGRAQETQLCHKSTEMLRWFGLEERASYKPHKLSAGQMKLTDLCRALVKGGGLLILDEPTVQVNEELAQRVRELIKGQSSEGKMVLVATNMDRKLISMADVVLDLSDYRA